MSQACWSHSRRNGARGGGPEWSSKRRSLRSMSAVSASPAHVAGRNQINLSNRTAVVAGGTGGIGLATAKRLLSSDATVLIWDIDDPALTQLKRELPALRTRRVDLLDEDAVADATASVIQSYGRIDILVN